jgi:hypothetical protein
VSCRVCVCVPAVRVGFVLLIAGVRRHEAAVALLIQHGADVRAKDDKLKVHTHTRRHLECCGGARSPAHCTLVAQIPLAYAKDAQISKLLQGTSLLDEANFSVGALTHSRPTDAMLVEGRGSRARSVASTISREELATSHSDDEARSALSPSPPLSCFALLTLVRSVTHARTHTRTHARTHMQRSRVSAR